MSNRIVIYGRFLESRLLFMAKSCLLNNENPRLIVQSLQNRLSDFDEQDCIKWLSKYHDIKLETLDDADLSSLSGDVCFVTLRGNFDKKERDHIRSLMRGFPRRIGLLRFANNSKSWQLKQILSEIRKPYYSMFTELWTEDSNLSLLRTFIKKSHRYFGALPHQRCSAGQENWDLLTSDAPLGQRPCLLAWAGSNNTNREQTLDWIETKLSQDKTSIDLNPVSGIHKVIWHNDLIGSCRQRDYADYLHELESAWFCLCLPGHTGTTNRVLEAVLRYAIPVLKQEQVLFHSLPLHDGVNAIFVKNDNWVEAIYRISNFSDADKLSMQHAVKELANSSAQLSTISSRLFKNLLGQVPQ